MANPNRIAIQGRVYTYPNDHEFVGQNEILDCIFMCGTCLRLGRAVDRGVPDWIISDEVPVNLPGYLSWIPGDETASHEILPPVITKMFTLINRMINCKRGWDRGLLSLNGEKIVDNHHELQEFLVPLFCSFCKDKVGFEKFQIQDGVYYSRGLLMDTFGVFDFALEQGMGDISDAFIYGGTEVNQEVDEQEATASDEIDDEEE